MRGEQDPLRRRLLVLRRIPEHQRPAAEKAAAVGRARRDLHDADFAGEGRAFILELLHQARVLDVHGVVAVREAAAERVAVHGRRVRMRAAVLVDTGVDVQRRLELGRVEPALAVLADHARAVAEIRAHEILDGVVGDAHRQRDAVVFAVAGLGQRGRGGRKLLPGLRRLLGIEAGFLEQILAVVERARLDGDRRGPQLAVEDVVALVARPDLVGDLGAVLGVIGRDVFVERGEGAGRLELGDDVVAQHRDVGKTAGRECGHEALLLLRPRHQLHVDLDVGIRGLELAIASRHAATSVSPVKNCQNVTVVCAMAVWPMARPATNTLVARRLRRRIVFLPCWRTDR